MVPRENPTNRAMIRETCRTQRKRVRFCMEDKREGSSRVTLCGRTEAEVCPGDGILNACAKKDSTHTCAQWWKRRGSSHSVPLEFDIVLIREQLFRESVHFLGLLSSNCSVYRHTYQSLGRTTESNFAECSEETRPWAAAVYLETVRRTRSLRPKLHRLEVCPSDRKYGTVVSKPVESVMTFKLPFTQGTGGTGPGFATTKLTMVEPSVSILHFPARSYRGSLARIDIIRGSWSKYGLALGGPNILHVS